MADDPDMSAIVHDQINGLLAALDPPEDRTAPYVTSTPPVPCATGLLNITLTLPTGIVRVFTIKVGPEWQSASIVMRWDNALTPPLRTAHLVGMGAAGQPVEVVELWRAE